MLAPTPAPCCPALPCPTLRAAGLRPRLRAPPPCAAGAAPLATQWELNRDAMLQYALRSTLGGLTGTVVRKGTNAPLDARIQGAPPPHA